MPNFRSSSRVSVSLNGTQILAKVNDLNFTGGVSVSDLGGGEASIDIIGTGGAGNQWIAALAFDFSDPAIIPVYLPVAAKEIVTVQIVVTEAFNNALATATVGFTGNVDLLMEAIENNLLVVGENESNPAENVAGGTQINLYLNAAGSTQGAGIVLIQTGL